MKRNPPMLCGGLSEAKSTSALWWNDTDKSGRTVSKYIVVFVTVKSKKEAKKITNMLLKNKLAACVNAVPGIASAYWWKGKIERAKELLLIIKTKKALFKKLTLEVKKVHSYEVPEIISLPLNGGESKYLKWIDQSVIK